MTQSESLPDTPSTAADEAPEAGVGEMARRYYQSLSFQAVEDLVARPTGLSSIDVEDRIPKGRPPTFLIDIT